jgi:hypothetical protein
MRRIFCFVFFVFVFLVLVNANSIGTEQPILIGGVPPSITGFSRSADVFVGGSSVLTWSTANADSCSIDNSVGAVAANGSVTVRPLHWVLYTITCTGPGGSISSTVIVQSIRLVGGQPWI